jgi:hypothetical protein
MNKVDITIQQHEVRDGSIRIGMSHRIKADVTITAHEIKAAEIKTTLNPVRRIDDTLVGYDAEIIIGPAIVEIESISQLDDIIDCLDQIIVPINGITYARFGPVTATLAQREADDMLAQFKALRTLWAENLKAVFTAKR